MVATLTNKSSELPPEAPAPEAPEAPEAAKSAESAEFAGAGAVAIAQETMLPDLLRAYPQVRPVLDRYGLRGCGGTHGPVESVGFFARVHGAPLRELLTEIKAAAAGAKSGADGAVRETRQAACNGAERREGGTGQGASAAAAPVTLTVGGGAPVVQPRLEDTLYRRFFLAGILVTLTAGATWGAVLLWQIGFAGAFTGISVLSVNAHGQAQIFGWMGLFILGFAYQALPRIWHTNLAWPRLSLLVFFSLLAGIALATVGMIDNGPAWAVPMAMVGCGLELLAVAVFALQMTVTFRRSKMPVEPYVGFVVMGLFWLVAQAAMSLWHTWNTMTAGSHEELLWYVATYQAPLRDLQIHGLGLFMVLGVCQRMLGPLFDLPAIGKRRAWTALGILTASVVTEIILFIAYRFSGNHSLAALLLLPWLGLLVGSAMIALPWRLWRRPAGDLQQERSFKFVRAGYAWLGISMVMLLLLPVYQLAVGVPFSHAYYGAIRHAITVGFVSLMIMGFAAKVVPTLNGVDTRKLSRLWGPFVLVNLGCLLRVSLQTLTDVHPLFFALVGISGVLEVTGLTWWGSHLAAIMIRGKQQQQEQALGPAPQRIEAGHNVADVLNWFPQTLPVFLQHGLTLLQNPLLRRTVARHTTLGQAASFRGVDLASLLADLNHVARAPLAREAAWHSAENHSLPHALGH